MADGSASRRLPRPYRQPDGFPQRLSRRFRGDTSVLLTTSGDRRVGTWAVGFCAAAAIAFIISVIGSTMLVTVLHPEAPSRLLDQDAVNRARLVSTLGFMLALYCLLITIGLGGWLRSRRTGLITSVLAAIGLVIATWGFGGF